MQAAAQRRTDVRRLKAAAGNLGKHRGEEQSVGLADKCELDVRIGTKFSLQAFGRMHSCKAAAQDYNVCLLCFTEHRCPDLRSPDARCQIVETLCQRTKSSSVDHPPQEGRKLVAHLFGVPLGLVPVKYWNPDHADQAPEGYAKGCSRHEAVHIGTARRIKTCRIARPHESTEDQAEKWMPQGHQQRSAGKQACWNPD